MYSVSAMSGSNLGEFSSNMIFFDNNSMDFTEFISSFTFTVLFGIDCCMHGDPQLGLLHHRSHDHCFSEK